MKGKFTISLDCEGKWGVADHLRKYGHKITQASLSEVYGWIFELLESYSIRASFAFTSLFACPEEIILDFRSDFKGLLEGGDSWYSSIHEMVENRATDGWVGHSFMRAAVAGGHEVCWHGFSHRTLGADCPRDSLRFELESGQKVSRQLNLEFSGIVFPRNEVGNLCELEKLGLRYFRESKENVSPWYRSRILRSLAEFNILSRAQENNLKDDSGMRRIPAGEFLNWPYGARAKIPDSVTVKRWRRILDDAELHGRCAHIWLHPHNLITAPRMRNTFSEVLRMASCRIRDDALVNATMSEL